MDTSSWGYASHAWIFPPLILHCASLGDEDSEMVIMVPGHTRSGDFLFCPTGDARHEPAAKCPDVLMLTGREDQSQNMAITGFARLCQNSTPWRAMPTSELMPSSIWRYVPLAKNIRR